MTRFRRNNRSRDLIMQLAVAWFTSVMSAMLYPALALDANAQSGETEYMSSMDDVAKMIRQKSGWQILDARSRTQGSVTWYRFKLISKKGRVKIIRIDPAEPNLRLLEQ